MKFFDNRILYPVGNGPTFDEWVKNFVQDKTASATEGEIVTASEAKPECDGDPRGQCRGQVINNDNEDGANSYQKGESVGGKPDQKEGGGHKTDSTATKEAGCGKEMGESSNAGKVTEDHTEAAPGDDNNTDCKQLINNDPNYQKGESTNPGKVKGNSKKDAPVGKSSSGNKFKKVASLNRKEKIQLFAVLAANKNNPLPYVEAMCGLKFANLTDNEKNSLRRFWRTMYPREYVETMIADR